MDRRHNIQVKPSYQLTSWSWVGRHYAALVVVVLGVAVLVVAVLVVAVVAVVGAAVVVAVAVAVRG